MTVSRPLQYQASKRALAPLILQYLPISTTRMCAGNRWLRPSTQLLFAAGF
jgi:hypothetical protein